MANPKQASQQIAKALDAATAELDALRQKAAEASGDDLQRLGAAIAGLTAKREALDARYAQAVASERSKETEAERKRLEQAHAEEVAAWRADRADLAQRWRAWHDGLGEMERQAKAMWATFWAMQAEISGLHKRGAPLGLEVGQLDGGPEARDRFERIRLGWSPLRDWHQPRG